MTAKGFRNLTAAGVLNTDKSSFLHEMHYRTNSLNCGMLSPMIIDSVSNLSLYEPVLPSIKAKDGYLYSIVEKMNAFVCEKKRSVLLIADKGDARIATGWRENKESKDVNAACILHEGEFALFLPGERYIVSECDRVIKYILE